MRTVPFWLSRLFVGIEMDPIGYWGFECNKGRAIGLESAPGELVCRDGHRLFHSLGFSVQYRLAFTSQLVLALRRCCTFFLGLRVQRCTTLRLQGRPLFRDRSRAPTRHERNKRRLEHEDATLLHLGIVFCRSGSPSIEAARRRLRSCHSPSGPGQ